MPPVVNLPRATYRLQFHCGFTLRDALAIVPYLSSLGVSHVYASPLLKAQTGSTHGYDVSDATLINPEIGTEEDLTTFVAALRERGMGLVLDIVPNHMAASPENPWWWDMLKNGRKSRFADYFDIDWESPDPGLRGKVMLPVLGDEYQAVLERGELRTTCENGVFFVRYFDHRFPVNPDSIASSSDSVDAAVLALNDDRKALALFLEQQHYRLANWRHGDSQLNYRRFFTITQLAGVRVELPQVFTDTHQRILDWHKRGLIDGLRVDHPDGLHDPQDYLSCLRRAAPSAWIVVEKILEPGEDLPADWPVQGTTGYDFLTRFSGLLIDPSGEKPLTDFYATFTGEPTDCPALVREKKRWILRHQLAAEVSRLVSLLDTIITKRSLEPAGNSEALRDALVELIACFPVYRTYAQAGNKGPLSQIDKQWISLALEQARKAKPQPSSEVLSFIIDLLQLKLTGDSENDFVMRFQQLTGPAMAKGVEDTTFYCFNRFVALNEVGGDPAHFGLSVEDFHRACAQTLEQWPNVMLASSTHDTKRSEDVRARLALLSEIPDEWAATVRRWSAMNEKHRRNNFPDRNAEYLCYQTLVGAWPLPVDRAVSYMEKASREAKQHTNWTDRDVAYDDALKHFVTSILADRDFTKDLEQFLAPLIQPGHINSLSQTLLKLTVPGVPDIYQGTDLWDLSLVDPDNRRPVDYGTRTSLLDELKKLSIEQVWKRREEGLPKLWLIQKSLQFRREHPELFGANGRYEPLATRGGKAAHLVAFARRHGDETALAVAPRLPLKLAGTKNQGPFGKEVWQDTSLVLPADLQDSRWLNLLTGEQITADSENGSTSLRLSDVLAKFPVALLTRMDR